MQIHTVKHQHKLTYTQEEDNITYNVFVKYSVTLVEFYLYPTVSTALVHSVKPKLTE